MTTGRRTRSEVADEAMEVALRVGASPGMPFFKLPSSCGGATYLEPLSLFNRPPPGDPQWERRSKVASQKVCLAPAPMQRMDGECCKGVPAALQPVQCGSHSMCVTVCDGCAAGRSTVDNPFRPRGHPQCAAQRLDACAATPAPTDCCSFVRQEAAHARSASTARPTRSTHCVFDPKTGVAHS